MGEAVGATMTAADAMMMGLVNYEEWASYWPHQSPEDNEFAPYMNGVRKYVVSTSLVEPLTWNNSTLIGDNVAEEIGKLKQEPGKDISPSPAVAPSSGHCSRMDSSTN